MQVYIVMYQDSNGQSMQVMCTRMLLMQKKRHENVQKAVLLLG